MCRTERESVRQYETVLQVDAVEFYKERIQALADAITKGSEHLLRDPESTLPAAFVTFKTRTAQVQRCSLVLGDLRAVCVTPTETVPSRAVWLAECLPEDCIRQHSSGVQGHRQATMP